MHHNRIFPITSAALNGCFVILNSTPVVCNTFGGFPDAVARRPNYLKQFSIVLLTSNLIKNLRRRHWMWYGPCGALSWDWTRIIVDSNEQMMRRAWRFCATVYRLVALVTYKWWCADKETNRAGGCYERRWRLYAFVFRQSLEPLSYKRNSFRWQVVRSVNLIRNSLEQPMFSVKVVISRRLRESRLLSLIAIGREVETDKRLTSLLILLLRLVHFLAKPHPSCPETEPWCSARLTNNFHWFLVSLRN